MGSEVYWELLHRRNFQKDQLLSDSVSEHAVSSEKLLVQDSKILDVGCGTGFDSRYFGMHGHSTVGIDISQSAIDFCNQKHGDIPNVSFIQQDLEESLEFEDSSFDLVYARLSLHYFSHSVTENIFAEIARVLKSEGRFIFICKSIDDPLYGKGESIEEDMYSLNGHVRHFFSPEYCRLLCEKDFVINDLESINGELYGKPSAYLYVATTKI